VIFLILVAAVVAIRSWQKMDEARKAADAAHDAAQPRLVPQ
jgi:hypothetical protein